MIPILYDKTETAFTSNGLGRLYDCISCTVTEERNGIYECDFEYPVTGANYEKIIIGRIVGVTHEDSNDIQPFDIVSFEKPIDGIVTFHAVHISYRQTKLTTYNNMNWQPVINDLATALVFVSSAEPSNPFSYSTDKTSTGYFAAADGTPRSVREFLGGIEGSILDTYGGEYEFDKWNVILHDARGQARDFSIRYGVNMLDYNDETDSTGSYSSCIPYWTDGETTVVGSKTDCGFSTVSGRDECVPLDLSDKFETAPSTASLQSTALSYMKSNNVYLPAQTITVSFVRLQDMPEYANFSNLLSCGLCDTINVVFPDYNTSGRFKIVKTVWNVLENRFDEMELGSLSTSLAEALGISNDLDKSSGGGIVPDDYVVDKGTSGDWVYRQWQSGRYECWMEQFSLTASTFSAWGNIYYKDYSSVKAFPTTFTAAPNVVITSADSQSWVSACWATTASNLGSIRFLSANSTSKTPKINVFVVGKV